MLAPVSYLTTETGFVAANLQQTTEANNNQTSFVPNTSDITKRSNF